MTFDRRGRPHPALLVDDLSALLGGCTAAGYPVTSGNLLPGYHRAYIADSSATASDFSSEQ